MFVSLLNDPVPPIKQHEIKYGIKNIRDLS